MSKKSQFLNQYITGPVYESSSVLDAYATDRSILKIKPSLVAVPHSVRDVRKLARFSQQLSKKGVALPITVRGSGLSETGASIGSGLVVSMEKMNRIQEIDAKQRLVRVQAGATLGQLNSALALHGLTLPVSSDPNKTIGGLIADYSCDPNTGHHNPILNFINQIEMVLSNGDTIQTCPLTRRQLRKKQGIVGFEGEIYRKVSAIIADNLEVIENPSFSTQNRAGYPLLGAVKQKRSFDLLPLLLGSQGTLGIITELVMHCSILKKEPIRVAATFEDFDEALDFIDNCIKQKASDVMLYDLSILHTVSAEGKTLRMLKTFPENGTLIIVAFDERKKYYLKRKIKRITKALPRTINFAVSDAENATQFAEIESILSVFLNSPQRGVRLPITNGVAVPRLMLKDYLIAIAKLEDEMNLNIPIYGSVLTGIYSARPIFRPESVIGRQEILSFLRSHASILREVGGHLAGASAEGRLQAIHSNLEIDPELKKVYKELKNIFDPNSIFNPGLKQDATARAVIRQLRTNYNKGIVY